MVRFRFYAELNDFLPAVSRGKQAKRHFDVTGRVKDLIESLEFHTAKSICS
jgi:hypothetical protein